MPIEMTDELRADFAADPATLAQFFKITLRDGTTLGLTNYWKPITDPEDGTLYRASNGLGPSAVQSSRSVGSGDNQDAQVFFDDDKLTEQAVEAGLLDGAEFEHFIANYKDITRGKLFKNRGYLGDLSSKGVAITGKFYGLEQILVSDILDVTGPICRYDFGDSQCKVDTSGDDANGVAITANDKTVSGGPVGTGPESDPRRCFVSSGLTAWPDSYFNEGKIMFTTGNNSGFGWFPVEQFSKNASGEVQLTRKFPYDIEVGDHFTIVAGCDHQMRGDCRNKYNNVINFGGEPGIPQERIYEEGDDSED